MDLDRSSRGRKPAPYNLVAHEIPPGWDITREGPSYTLAASIAFRDVNPADYSGLFLTGGRAPEYLRYDPHLMRIVQHFFTEGTPVAVVCHGAEIVASADVIRGKAAGNRAEVPVGYRTLWRNLCE